MNENILYLILLILTIYATVQIKSKWGYYSVIKDKRISFTSSVFGTLALSFLIVWGFTFYVIFGILPTFENPTVVAIGMGLYFILGNTDMYLDAVIRSEIERD